MTPIAQPPCCGVCGSNSRTADSRPTSAADAATKPACSREAKASALP